MPKLSEIPAGLLSEQAAKTRFIILATVNEFNQPVQRALGSWALDGITLYFSTGAQSAKVKHIRQNPNVSIIVQQEGQELGTFVNVAINGTAVEAVGEEQRKKVIGAISAKSPRFKERAEKGLLGDSALFTVNPRLVKVLDFSKGNGPAATVTYDI